MLKGLQGLGLTFSVDFLNQEAGFGIAEGGDYTPSDTYLQAFWVGVINTLKVSILGILFATVLGLFFGVIRLSSNYLVKKIASIYVECFRNIPLLLQILFWYTAVMLQLPPVRQSLTLYQSIYINQRGIYLPWFQPAQGLKIWIVFVVAGLGAGCLLYLIGIRRLRRSGSVGFPSLWAVTIFMCVAVSGWYLTEQIPFSLDIPVLQRFNFTGGIRLTPEFSALLLGLSVYTSSFIAEIVRGGIQSVKRGQREAAKAIGLKEFQILRLVVLPQALRIIIPPLTNQYLNLAKNSSLAIAVGFPDLFNIGNTMMNQTGQSIPVFAIIMFSYLIMSLTTSLFLNWYNRKVRIVEQ